MEFARIEERTDQVQSDEKMEAVVELSNLQLAIIGGGFGDVSYT